MEECAMAFQLPQQDPSVSFNILKSVASPQHGQKADKKAIHGHETRILPPRPGH
jgi:hypothetical protein